MRTATGSGVRAALVLAALLAPGLCAAAEVTFQARVDRAELAQDELVTLELRLESPDPPEKLDTTVTTDFEVVAREKSREPLISMGGGGGVQIRNLYTIVYRLRPTRTGALTVPSFTAVVRGRSYATQPIVVKVSAAGALPRGPGASPAPGAKPQTPAQPPPRGGWAYRGWEKDVALRAELGRREVFVGEQVPVEFWLVSPYPVAHYGSATTPHYEGFWQEVLDTPRELRPVARGAQVGYMVQRLALFPTRTGELTVDPFDLREVSIPVRGGGFDVSGDVVQLERRSAPVTVKVKPLPAGPPPGFEPANVGSLSLEVSATPERVAVGEPITVRMIIRGDGNVRAVVPPRLPEVAGARAFAPASADRAEPRGGRFLGTRTVETVLVPDRAGELVVPGLEWPFFDPHSGKYQTVLTPALRVTVVPAAAAPPPREALPGGRAVAGGLRGIRADAALRRSGPPPWQLPGFLALLLAPPLLFLALVIAGRLRAGEGTRAARLAGPRARRTLAGARRRMARDPAAGLGEIERALLGYAAGRLGRPAAGLRREELASALARAGAHPPAVSALLRALDLVDACRYGAGDAHGEEVLTAAEDALAALDEADWQPDREVGA
jgi:hypothetical protein